MNRLHKAFWSKVFRCKVFWWAFALTPLTQLPWYHSLPDEDFDPEQHIALDYGGYRERCSDRYGCVVLPNVWKDKHGRIYSHRQTAAHRENETYRMAVWGFSWGLIGCFGWAGFRNRETEPDFWKPFGAALIVNTFVVAIVIGLFGSLLWP
jgi:hypothetical protein